ncbi:hypothetical protein I3843_16G001700 [Carya illinoinensis]|nr:hypothetical protein I3843_16G001700 [Carya illinoinensis]
MGLKRTSYALDTIRGPPVGEAVHQARPPQDFAPESQPELDYSIDAEDYVNNEERFNVTERLAVLFPRIDVQPVDWFLTEHEFTESNLQQAEREVMYRTQRELDTLDKNKDGFVSFAEYDPPGWVQNADNNSFGYGMSWWKEEHFNASDADGDGLLNLTSSMTLCTQLIPRTQCYLSGCARRKLGKVIQTKMGRLTLNNFVSRIL